MRPTVDRDQLRALRMLRQRFGDVQVLALSLLASEPAPSYLSRLSDGLNHLPARPMPYVQAANADTLNAPDPVAGAFIGTFRALGGRLLVQG